MSDSKTVPLIRVLPFQFSGNAREYFKIWIINLFLTIITLGIYSAWAKVRKQRYFYGNTYLNNNRFSYLADPVKILKGRIIAVTALVVYSLSWDLYPDAGILFLGIGLLLFPFILVTASSFQMRNTGYRNIRFYFSRDYKTAYRQLAWPLSIIMILTLVMYLIFDVNWLMGNSELGEDLELVKSDFLSTFIFFAFIPIVPHLDYLRSRFIINHTQYGKLKANFEGCSWNFYKLYIFTFFFSLFTFIIVLICFGGIMYLVSSNTGLNDPKSELFPMEMVFTLLTLVYAASFIISAYIRAKRTNMIFEKTSFGEMRIYSRLKTFPISWIYLSNIFAIITSMGLLIPWAKIRMSKYVASCTEMESRSFSEIEVQQENDRTALGEEMIDAFDLDLGL